MNRKNQSNQKRNHVKCMPSLNDPSFLKLNPVHFVPVLLLTATAMLRIYLYPVIFPDFTQLLDPWLNVLREYGPSAISSGFANYNSPYLFLLWIFSFFSTSNLAVVKMIATVFDIIMAIGVLKTVEYFKPKGFLKYAAAAGILVLPTILINSGAWGQCDSVVAAFTIWAVYLCLKDKLLPAWALIGFAFAVKMQGIFLAPFLLAISLNRRKRFVTGPLIAIISCVLLSAPTLLLGDTPQRIAGVFLGGMGDMFGDKYLSWWMANLWQWFPNSHYDLFRLVAVATAAVVAVLILIYGYRSKRLNDQNVLTLAAFCLIIMPFVLPQMHNRYYYQGEILLFVLAFIIPRAAWYIYLTQFVTISTIYIALTGVERDFWAFKILVFGVLVVVIGLVRMLIASNKDFKEVFIRRKSKTGVNTAEGKQKR